MGFTDSKIMRKYKKATKTALNKLVYLKGGSLKNPFFPI